MVGKTTHCMRNSMFSLLSPYLNNVLSIEFSIFEGVRWLGVGMSDNDENNIHTHLTSLTPTHTLETLKVSLDLNVMTEWTV